MQTELVFRFFSQIGTVFRKNLIVRIRIIALRINTVDDPAQAVRPVIQQSVEAIAVIRSPDLIRIGRTDRSDMIAVDNPGLHIVHIAVILHTVKIAVIQIQQLT
ncbi:hypothetical protein D3C80_1318210 [compost metagenome]